MGVYGAGVVGEEQAAKNLEQQSGTAKFGDRVLGTRVDERTEEERLADLEAREARKELEKKTSRPTPPELEDLVAKYASDDGYLSISDVKEVLEEMPSALDRMIAWEMERADGPRIGALKHFISLEAQRQGGARAPVIQHLESALAAVQTRD